MKPSTERERLLAAVQYSRRELSQGLLQTRKAVDITSRVKASVQKNLVWWIGGAAVAGLCLASATSEGRTKVDAKTGEKVSVARTGSFFSAIAKLSRYLFSISSPVLKAFLTREVASALSKISQDKTEGA